MSGRIRTVKPELLEDAVTAGLSDTAFRIFIAVILLADDFGNFRAEPGFIRGQVYWAVRPETSVEEALDDLAKARLVSYYAARGQWYGAIRTWAKNQRVQKPGKPRVPGPEQADSGVTLETFAALSGKSPEDSRPDLRSPISDQRPPARRDDVAPVALPPAAGSGVRGKPLRGTRMTECWSPGAAVLAWAREHGIAAPLGPLGEFRDYWLGISGAKGVKLDWDATYRNRLRDLVRQGRIEISEPLSASEARDEPEDDPPASPEERARFQAQFVQIEEQLYAARVVR